MVFRGSLILGQISRKFIRSVSYSKYLYQIRNAVPFLSPKVLVNSMAGLEAAYNKVKLLSSLYNLGIWNFFLIMISYWLELSQISIKLIRLWLKSNQSYEQKFLGHLKIYLSNNLTSTDKIDRLFGYKVKLLILPRAKQVNA